MDLRVEAADGLLAAADLPAGLRRVVLERRDDVQLALAFQEVSRTAGLVGNGSGRPAVL